MKIKYLVAFLIILLIILGSTIILSQKKETNPKKTEEIIQNNNIKLFFPIYEKLTEEQAIDLASKYDLLIMHSINKDKIKIMKETNPNIILLEYKSFFLCDGSDTADTTIEGYSQAKSNWFTTSKKSKIGDNAAKSNCYLLDIKNQEVINYAKKQYIKEVQEDGFDGLFMDAVSLEPIGNYASSLDQYEDNKEWQKYLLIYLQTIHKEFNDKLFILNLVEFETIENYNNFANQGDAITQLFSVCDGGLDEVYLMGKWQNNIIYYRDPERALEAQEFAANNNKFFLGYSQIETCQSKDLDFVFTTYKQISNPNSYLNPTCSAHHTFNIALNNYEKVKGYL